MKLMLFIVLFLLSLFSLVDSTTLLVDGVSQWKNPIVHVGDSIIFKHKYNYTLYIFRNRNAFNLCNFSQATLLTTNPSSSTYTWHTSRPGFFYFTFNNGSMKTCNGSQKLSIKVLPPESSSGSTLPPEIPPIEAPPPATGGVVSSSPSYPWPYRPRQDPINSPRPAPSSFSPMTMPTVVPDKGGGSGMPFINSNPAVPLPTGEVDSATIRPMSTSADATQVVVGLFSGQVMMILLVTLVL